MPPIKEDSINSLRGRLLLSEEWEYPIQTDQNIAGNRQLSSKSKSKKSKSNKSGDYHYDDNAPIYKNAHSTRTRGKKSKGYRESSSRDSNLYLATDGDDLDKSYYYHAGQTSVDHYGSPSSEISSVASDYYIVGQISRDFKSGGTKGLSKSKKSKHIEKYTLIDKIQQELYEAAHYEDLKSRSKAKSKSAEHWPDYDTEHHYSKSFKHRGGKGSKSKGSKNGKGESEKKCKIIKKSKEHDRGHKIRHWEHDYSSTLDDHADSIGYGYANKLAYGYASKSKRGKKQGKKVNDYVYHSESGWFEESPGVETYYYYGGYSNAKSKKEPKSKRSKSKGRDYYDDNLHENDEYYYVDCEKTGESIY